MTHPYTQHTLTVDGREATAFFLRGHMRSGTNWVCELLNLHPAISCHGEYHFLRLREAFDRYSDASWLPASDAKTRAAAQAGFRETVRSCLAVQAGRSHGATLVGDRTPERLECLLPGAPILHITRDGRDVLVSWMFHLLRLGMPIEDERMQRDLEPTRARFREDPGCFVAHPHDLLTSELLVRQRARAWAQRVRHDQAFIERSRAGEVDARVHAIRYEDLHADVDGVRGEMYTFLGLDPGEAAPVETSDTAVPGFGDRPERPESFHRAGRVGDWRTYFTEDTERWFHDEASDALDTMGYSLATI